jgi:hypothetical protein
VPAEFVTLTSTVPADSASVIAVRDVGEFTVKLRAATDPNMTADTFEKLVPMTTTDVPPAAGPLVVPSPVTDGVLVGAV